MAKKSDAVEAAAAVAVQVPVAGGRVGMALRSVVDRVQGARLCYGEPVTSEGRTVIPVARVTARGGLGFGGDEAEGGGGGGGKLGATPVGYIEITADGTRFTPIDDGMAQARLVRSVAGGLGRLAVLLAIARRLRRG